MLEALAFIFFLVFVFAIIGVLRPYRFLPKWKRGHYIAVTVLSVLIVGMAAPEHSARVDASSEPDSAATTAEASAPAEVATTPQVEQAKLQKAANDAEEFWKLEKLPKGAPEAPVTFDCQDELCVGSKAQFERHDWPKAWQGDYAGQRNVAHCRSTGCNGAVEINQAEACAWRALIIEKHAATTTDGDSANFKADCGKLDAAGAASASAKAEELLKHIYHGA